MIDYSAAHDTSADFPTANRAYFDKQAGQLRGHGHSRELGRKNVTAMRRAWPGLFNGDSTVAMDYACGTGLIFVSRLAKGDTDCASVFVSQETSPSSSANM